MAMVAVIGQFRLPVASMETGLGAMRKVLEATRAEAGCIAYSYAEDLLEPGLIRISELWESAAHLAAHFNAPHMAEWIKTRAELGLTDRDVSRYTISDSAKV